MKSVKNDQDGRSMCGTVLAEKITERKKTGLGCMSWILGAQRPDATCRLMRFAQVA